MKLPSQSISITEARAQGYKPLTVRYHLPGQRQLLDATQRDLDAGKINYVLVGDPTAPEIWRMGLIDLAEKNCVPIEHNPRGSLRPLTV